MENSIKKEVLKVHGMSCTNCAMGIKLYLEKNNYKEVNVNFSAGEVSLEIKTDGERDKAIELIESLGYAVDETDKKKRKIDSI